MKQKYYKKILALFTAILFLISFCTGCSQTTEDILDDILSTYANTHSQIIEDMINDSYDFTSPDAYEMIPEWDQVSPYIEINNNIPTFTEDEITTESFEYYSNLDALGRCGIAVACVGTDIMPTEKRGAIGQVKPTGWHTVKYPELISDLYLYNRCHLIGYQLTGENANKQNLITGTRYLNVDGMLPFENAITDYVKETGNHVMYRVTPLFYFDELVARGVYMEAYSVEDNGEGISFNIYCFNVQPHIEIDYTTGESWIAE